MTIAGRPLNEMARSITHINTNVVRRWFTVRGTIQSETGDSYQFTQQFCFDSIRDMNDAVTKIMKAMARRRV